jgi:exopolysaccharide production protein ExoQ
VIPSIHVTENPVRYSTPILLLLSCCLLFAQHYLPSVIHEGMSNDYQVAQSSGNFVRQIAYLVIGLIGILGVTYGRRLRKPIFAATYWLIVPVGMLLCWCLLSLLWSDMPLIATKRIVVIGLVFLGSFGLASSWESVDIVRFISLSSAIHVSIGFVSEVVSGYFTPASAIYRFGGTLTPNEQGYLCMMLATSSMCMRKMMRLRGMSTWLYSILAVYGVFLLLLTRSRGALVAFGIAILFYFFLVMRTQKKVLTVFLVGSFVIMLSVTGSGAKLVDALGRSGEGSENFTGRAPLWTELMDYVDERPWTGHGYESFWNAQTMDDVYRHQHWPVDSAHSEYVESLLTIGIVGMILHTIALLGGMIEGIRLFRTGHNVVFFLASVMCCVYLAGGYLEAILIVKASPISFYLALLLSSMMVRSQTKETGIPLRAAPSFASTQAVGKLERQLARGARRLTRRRLCGSSGNA